MSWKKAAIAILIPAIGIHLFLLFQTPRLVMGQVFDRLQADGFQKYHFRSSEPATPDNQPVVRPSPDLAYALCWFDLSEGPVEIRGGMWDGYGSLAVFNANTDVVFFTSLTRADAESGGVVLAHTGDSANVMSTQIRQTELPVVLLDAPMGVALIRRLAPTNTLFAAARRVGQNDVCTQLDG